MRVERLRASAFRCYAHLEIELGDGVTADRRAERRRQDLVARGRPLRLSRLVAAHERRGAPRRGRRAADAGRGLGRRRGTRHRGCRGLPPGSAEARHRRRHPAAVARQPDHAVSDPRLHPRSPGGRQGRSRDAPRVLRPGGSAPLAGRGGERAASSHAPSHSATTCSAGSARVDPTSRPSTPGTRRSRTQERRSRPSAHAWSTCSSPRSRRASSRSEGALRRRRSPTARTGRSMPRGCGTCSAAGAGVTSSAR